MTGSVTRRDCPEASAAVTGLVSPSAHVRSAVCLLRCDYGDWLGQRAAGSAVAHGFSRSSVVIKLDRAWRELGSVPGKWAGDQLFSAFLIDRA